MGWRTRDDRGLVATEAGLLYGGVALFFVPVLFLLGTVVKGVFSDAGDKVKGQSTGSAQQPAPDPADPVVVATAQLQTELETSGAYAGTSVTCATLPEPTPPAGTVTDCVAVRPDGSTQQITVTWNGDGSYTVS